MIYTKPKRNFIRVSVQKTPRFTKQARLIARELHEGLFVGVADDPQLLHGQYDDESSSSVDPFCRLGGDRFGREFVGPSAPQTTVEDTTPTTSDGGSELKPIENATSTCE